MFKHVLVTVSGQRSAFYSLRFLERFFTDRSQFRITLFADAPKVEPRRGERRDSGTATARKILSEAREQLLWAGFPEEMIDSRTQLQQLSTAMDIIQESERGGYDAIALGKRTISRLEEFLERSTTKEVLEKAALLPLWFCRPLEESCSGMLLCMDGSEASERMADHVGRILQVEPSQRITLFRVTDRAGAGKGEALEKGRAILRGRGIPQENILTETAVSSHPGKTIADKAGREAYAVVAVGRTGRGSGALKKLILGSTSHHLFRELTRSTLWVCR